MGATLPLTVKKTIKSFPELKPNRKVTSSKMDYPDTPVTSRSGCIRNRRRSYKHPIGLLQKGAKGQDQIESNAEKSKDTTTSSMDAETSQLISDDSGIDVSQNSNPGEGHRYFLRKRSKDPF